MNVVNLDNKKFPMTLLINLDTSGHNITDGGNIFNNGVNSNYLVNLIGYYKVKITRFEMLSQSGSSSSPSVISLISPVFQQQNGNTRYPIFLMSRNVTALQTEFSDVSRATNVSDDTYYIYNFSGNFPLYIADIFPGYLSNNTFFKYSDPTFQYMATLSLELEKL